MKAYELQFLDARGTTLLAYMGDFTDDTHALRKLASLRDIPCDRAELWCGDELILSEQHLPKSEPPTAAQTS